MKKLTQQQALELIEMMVFDIDENTSVKKLLKVTGEIYQVAHAHNKSHTCHYVHNNWREQAAQLFPGLRKVTHS